MTTEMFMRTSKDSCMALPAMNIMCADCGVILETSKSDEMIDHLKRYHTEEIDSVSCDRCREAREVVQVAEQRERRCNFIEHFCKINKAILDAPSFLEDPRNEEKEAKKDINNQEKLMNKVKELKEKRKRLEDDFQRLIGSEANAKAAITECIKEVDRELAEHDIELELKVSYDELKEGLTVWAQDLAACGVGGRSAEAEAEAEAIIDRFFHKRYKKKEEEPEKVTRDEICHGFYTPERAGFIERKVIQRKSHCWFCNRRFEKDETIVTHGVFNLLGIGFCKDSNCLDKFFDCHNLQYKEIDCTGIVTGIPK